MVEKLKQAIKENHNLSCEAAEYIAKYIVDENTTISEDDIDYFLDNLRVFDSIELALDYESYDRDAVDMALSLRHEIVEKEHIGKSLAEVWLGYYDYKKVDIENVDIWFTIYQ